MFHRELFCVADIFLGGGRDALRIHPHSDRSSSRRHNQNRLPEHQPEARGGALEHAGVRLPQAHEQGRDFAGAWVLDADEAVWVGFFFWW